MSKDIFWQSARVILANQSWWQGNRPSRIDWADFQGILIVNSPEFGKNFRFLREIIFCCSFPVSWPVVDDQIGLELKTLSNTFGHLWKVVWWTLLAFLERYNFHGPQSRNCSVVASPGSSSTESREEKISLLQQPANLERLQKWKYSSILAYCIVNRCINTVVLALIEM